MTSGYYQCPISETCKALTAFITFMGTYEWNRVPMGPKGSASYFQQQIATVVLVGLVYHICEQYLDDILAYASSGKELLIRLRLLFERFRKFKITLNPDKCKLGLSSVEYTGHVIDETGLSFTDKKLSGVKAFPIPDTQKQLKSFLGLANYFRDHVRNLSIIVQPLQQQDDTRFRFRFNLESATTQWKVGSGRYPSAAPHCDKLSHPKADSNKRYHKFRNEHKNTRKNRRE